MVFDYYISTAIDEYNIHFDIYYRKNGEFGHTKEGHFLTAFQSMTFYGKSVRQILINFLSEKLIFPDNIVQEVLIFSR